MPSSNKNLPSVLFGGARSKRCEAQECIKVWRFDEVRAELVRDISSHFDFFDLFFNFFEEERNILAFPGFEPTRLWDPSDLRRL